MVRLSIPSYDTLLPLTGEELLGSIAMVACLQGGPLVGAVVEMATHQDNTS
jgi:hypothetical protein